MTKTAALHELDPHDVWDVLVIGAGLAGAVTSYLLASQGVRTLLVEAKSFPRPKVCGGCLSERAISALRAVGLGGALDGCMASRIDGLDVVQGKHRVAIPLPLGRSISRSVLDTALVNAAVDVGATFVDDTRCRVLHKAENNCRLVRMTAPDGGRSVVKARVVVACDGLGHPSLVEFPRLASTISPRSKIGLGCVVDVPTGSNVVAEGRILMAVAEQGYVGLAGAESQRMSIAAAVNPAALADCRSPTLVVSGILQSAGIDSTWMHDGFSLRGTPPITQFSSRVADERLFLIGDAAGYVEPFTGEGMAAAIEGAIAVAPFALASAKQWNDRLANQWQVDYTRLIRSRQLICRSLAWLLRHPHVLQWGLARVARRPSLGLAIAKMVGASPRS